MEFRNKMDSIRAPNIKRPNDDDVDINQVPQKRNRLECVGPYNEVLSTKFMDLNDGCLEKIGEYLNPESLMNVANSNQRLRIAARSVYSRKFGARNVRINFRFDHEFPQFNILSYNIKLDNAKMCFQFLRGLGPAIMKLELHYHHLNKQYCEHVDHYINKYCASVWLALNIVISLHFRMTASNWHRRPWNFAWLLHTKLHRHFASASAATEPVDLDRRVPQPEHDVQHSAQKSINIQIENPPYHRLWLRLGGPRRIDCICIRIPSTCSCWISNLSTFSWCCHRFHSSTQFVERAILHTWG